MLGFKSLRSVSYEQQINKQTPMLNDINKFDLKPWHYHKIMLHKKTQTTNAITNPTSLIKTPSN
jgi:hypothetical protein